MVQEFMKNWLKLPLISGNLGVLSIIADGAAPIAREASRPAKGK
jgi:hypothetical protein